MSALPDSRFRVLVVDDEATIRELVTGRLSRRGYACESAANGREALGKIAAFAPDVVVTDLRMPELDGFGLIRQLQVPSIIITGHGDKEAAIEAVAAGAFAFFEKPFDLDALELATRRAAEKRAWLHERETLLAQLKRLTRLQNRELESFDRDVAPAFIGEHPRILEIKELLARLARKPHASLLVLGETGTGKEVIARELHRSTHGNAGERSPFLALNCSALPMDLLESELFGHEKGAFSGAVNTRVGLAEAVREGTLFLDEIGELDLRHQAKILRFVQEREFRRVGGNRTLTFAGRIVTATHRNLLERAKAGHFREDLYYRLSVVALTLPALRDRVTDLGLLARALCHKHGLRGLSNESLLSAQAYEWPGNVRELNNWIERASILGQHDDEGFVTSLVERYAAAGAATPPRPLAEWDGASPADLKALRAELLDWHETVWIERALDAHSGNISAAAKVLGIDRKNLARRMRELDIKRAA
jgi:DNA-binding NtrC family response regulator